MSGFNRIPPAEGITQLGLLEDAITNLDNALDQAKMLKQAARNLLATLTPEGEVEKLAARDLAELLDENHV